MARRTFRPQQDRGNSASKQLGDYWRRCTAARLGCREQQRRLLRAHRKQQARTLSIRQPAPCSQLARHTAARLSASANRKRDAGKKPCGARQRRRQSPDRSGIQQLPAGPVHRGRHEPPSRTRRPPFGPEGSLDTKKNNKTECFSVKRIYIFIPPLISDANVYLIINSLIILLVFLSPLQTAQLRTVIPPPLAARLTQFPSPCKLQSPSFIHPRGELSR